MDVKSVSSYRGGILKSYNERRDNSVTVCIAAIYDKSSIIGASDRMISATDIEFEPPTSKIINLTNSIAVMTAGDSNIQEQILAETHKFVGKRIKANPKKWIPVVDVAKFYRDAYTRIRRDTIEREILSRYGLTYDSFITRQKELSPKVLEEISEGMTEFELPGVETIVAGVDDTGPHIFTVMDDRLNFDDSAGFSAVGSGYSHALSHMMLAGHAPSTGEAKTLLAIHQAKKKAEVSPGVGSATDMFVVGPNPGNFIFLDAVAKLDVIKDLDGFYDKYRDEVQRLNNSHESELQKYLEGLAKRVEQSQQADPPTLEVKVSDTVQKPKKTPKKKK